MAIRIKAAKLWVMKANDRAGLLADALGALSAARTDLGLVMGWHERGAPGRAVIEVWPISGKRAETAAKAAGFVPSETHCLLIEGDDKLGVCAGLGKAVAAAGVSMHFLMSQVVGRRYATTVGFGSAEDAAKAAHAIRAAARKG